MKRVEIEKCIAEQTPVAIQQSSYRSPVEGVILRCGVRTRDWFAYRHDGGPRVVADPKAMNVEVKLKGSEAPEVVTFRAVISTWAAWQEQDAKEQASSRENMYKAARQEYFLRQAKLRVKRLFELAQIPVENINGLASDRDGFQAIAEPLEVMLRATVAKTEAAGTIISQLDWRQEVWKRTLIRLEAKAPVRIVRTETKSVNQRYWVEFADEPRDKITSFSYEADARTFAEAFELPVELAVMDEEEES